MSVKKIRIKDLSLHKHSFLNPLQSDSQFNGLKSNLERNGQLDPIRISNMEVFDGRHRLKALGELGEEFIMAQVDDELTDEDIYDIVKSSEIRRHQTVIQRSISAWKDYELSLITEDTKKSQGMVALEYGVGKNAIGDVATLYKMRPELVDILWNGQFFNVGTMDKPRYTDKLKTILTYLKSVEKESYSNRTIRAIDEDSKFTVEDLSFINKEVSSFETKFENDELLEEAIRILYSRLKKKD